MGKKYTILFGLFLALNTAWVNSAIINVPADYSKIQSALNSANNGDSVLVQAGIYYENLIWPDIKGIRLISNANSNNTIIDGSNNGRVLLIAETEHDSTTIINGFTFRNGKLLNGNFGAGIKLFNAGSPLIINSKIINNKISSSGIIGGAGLAIISSSPVVLSTSVSDNIVNSCWIYDENHDLYSVVDEIQGVGLHIYMSNLTVFNEVTVSDNTTECESNLLGTGIYVKSSNLNFSNTVISNNNGTTKNNINRIHSGAGIYIENVQNAIIKKSKINNNKIINISDHKNYIYGGGISIKNSNAEFSEVYISENEITTLGEVTGLYGAGVFISDLSIVKFKNSVINGNMMNAGSIFLGGGISVFTSNVDMVNSSIENNIFDNSLNNVDFESYGGGIFSHSSVINLTNSTIAGNSSTDTLNSIIGSGIYISDSNFIPSNILLINTISWNPSIGEEIKTDAQQDTSRLRAKYSNIRKGWVGAGNINNDPLFASDVNFHLQLNSPSIGKGTSVGTPEFDIYGLTRKSPPDMGAYESKLKLDVDLSMSTSCFGFCIGKAVPQIRGGIEPFTFVFLPENDTISLEKLNSLCEGIYMLKVIDSIGYTDTVTFEITGSESVYPNNNSKVSFEATETFGCGSLNTKLSFITNSELNYVWTFKNDSIVITSEETEPEMSFSDTGYYNVSLFVTNNYDCQDLLSIDSFLQIALKPIAGFEISDTLVCQYVPVTYTDKSENALSWHWEFGDGNISTLQNPNRVFTAHGELIVKQKVFNGLCKDSSFANVTVLEAPKPGFYLSANEYCTGEPIYVSNRTQGSFNSIFYSNGKGDTVSHSSTVFSYSEPGSYTITQFVEGGPSSCKLTFSQVVIIHQTPEANFHVSAEVNTCGESEWHIENSSLDASSFSWKLGNNITNVVHPKYVFNESGTYLLQLTASNMGCISNYSKNLKVTVRDLPEADFDVSDTLVCAPDYITFINNSINAEQFYWDMGTGTLISTDDTSAFEYLFENEGIYDISLMAISNEGCEVSITRTSYIKVLPEIENDFPLSEEFAYCQGDTITLTAPGNFMKYDWSNGITDTGSINIFKPGDYFVKVENNAGCSGISAKVTIFETPQPEIFNLGEDEFCYGDQTILATTEPYESYIWSEGSNTNELIVTQSGFYTVTVTNENGCENTSENYLIIVYEVPPAIELTSQNDSVIIKDPHPNMSRYEWYFEESIFETGTDAYIKAAYPGNFNVIGFTKEECRVLSDTTEVLFNDFMLFPNPSNGKFKVQAIINETTNFKVHITDISGRHIFRYSEQNYNGLFIKDFNLAELLPGTYIFKLETDVEVFTEKLIIN